MKLFSTFSAPTLVDEGLIVWNSRAIVTYLIDKYAKDDKLYPKDLQARAQVNQFLFFESNLYSLLSECGVHVAREGGTHFPQSKIKLIYASYEILETFWVTDTFLVQNILTVADISVACSVTALNAIYAPLSAVKHPKILAWLKRVEDTVQFFDEWNFKYLIEYRDLMLSLMEKNKLTQ